MRTNAYSIFYSKLSVKDILTDDVSEAICKPTTVA